MLNIENIFKFSDQIGELAVVLCTWLAEAAAASARGGPPLAYNRLITCTLSDIIMNDRIMIIYHSTLFLDHNDKPTMSFPIQEISTKPFEGQKPGTSGLRKRWELLSDPARQTDQSIRIELKCSNRRSNTSIYSMNRLTNRSVALYGELCPGHLRLHRTARRNPGYWR